MVTDARGNDDCDDEDDERDGEGNGDGDDCDDNAQKMTLGGEDIGGDGGADAWTKKKEYGAAQAMSAEICQQNKQYLVDSAHT